jgi:N6-L-threonylcarbamoyladenine synthase
MLEADPPQYPFIALLVSGGHTMLAEVRGLGEYHMLGSTLDDAAGEAFDKTAKVLGLGYPGGPALAKLAESGNAARYSFPRPMLDRPSLDFSFSGLKTAVVHAVKATVLDDQSKADIASSFQEAVVDTLAAKCLRAMQQSNSNTLVVAGGVGANRRLRERLLDLGNQHGFAVRYPRLEFCTDNAAMIAYAGCQRLLKGEHDGLAIRATARWSMDSLQPPTATS